MTESNPFISVVIPSFNREHTLKKAVASVLAQTHTNLECLVVDDHARVPVQETLASFRDERLRVIRHETNMGVGAARNTGAKAAHGAYLAFLDDDDVWLPSKLEKQVKEQRTKDDVAILTDFSLAGDQVFYRRKNSKQNPAWLIVTGGALLMGSTMFLNRDLYKDVGDFNPELRRAEDWDWLLRFHKRGHQAFILPESLVVYAGAHRSSPGVEQENIQKIQKLHAVDFRGKDDLSHAFQAAMEWKQARIDFAEHKATQGAMRMVSAWARHPRQVHRYMKNILCEPLRQFLGFEKQDQSLQASL